MIRAARTLAAAAALSLGLSACTPSDVTGAIATVAQAAAALDAGVTAFAAQDVPLVCAALGAFVGAAQDVQAAGLVSASVNLPADIALGLRLEAGPGCAPGTTPASTAQLLSDIGAAVAAIKADVGGRVTVTGALAARRHRHAK